MVLLRSPRLYFVRQYGKGIGKYYTTLEGKGVFKDSLKSLARYLLNGSKHFYSLAKPKAIALAKHTVNELKPKIQKTLTEASARIIDSAINNPAQIRETAKESIRELKDTVTSSIPEVKENAKRTLHEILHGGSVKLANSKSKRILSKLLRASRRR